MIPSQVEMKNGTKPIPTCGHNTLTTQCGGNGAILQGKAVRDKFASAETLADAPQYDQERNQIGTFGIDLDGPKVKSGLPSWENQ